MVFAYAAARRSRSHLVAAITKRKNHANPLWGQGSLSAFAYSGIHSLHLRHRNAGQVMAGLVRHGFSPGRAGGGPRAVRPPRPPPHLRGKTRGGFHLKAVYYLLALSSFHNLGGILASMLGLGYRANFYFLGVYHV